MLIISSSSGTPISDYVALPHTETFYNDPDFIVFDLGGEYTTDQLLSTGHYFSNPWTKTVNHYGAHTDPTNPLNWTLLTSWEWSIGAGGGGTTNFNRYWTESVYRYIILNFTGNDMFTYYYPNISNVIMGWV